MQPSESPGPVERFKPTSGFVLGYAALAAVAFGVVYALVVAPTVGGARVALGLACFGVLVYVTQIRPRAAAYPGFVRLRNSFSDVDVPYKRIDEVDVRQMLSVHVGEERYVCIGIGQSRRARRAKLRGNQPSLMGARLLPREFSKGDDRASNEERATRYETWVVRRIEELVEEDRRDHPAAPAGEVVRHWAWPELVALGVLAIGFAVSCFL